MVVLDPRSDARTDEPDELVERRVPLSSPARLTDWTRAEVGDVAEEVGVAEPRRELHRDDMEDVPVASIVDRFPADRVERCVINRPADAPRRGRREVESRDGRRVFRPVKSRIRRHDVDRERERLRELEDAAAHAERDDADDPDRSADDALATDDRGRRRAYRRERRE